MQALLQPGPQGSTTLRVSGLGYAFRTFPDWCPCMREIGCGEKPTKATSKVLFFKASDSECLIRDMLAQRPCSGKVAFAAYRAFATASKNTLSPYARHGVQIKTPLAASDHCIP